MIYINEEETKKFKQEWDKAVEILKNSRADLSKIEIMPVQREYTKED